MYEMNNINDCNVQYRPIWDLYYGIVIEILCWDYYSENTLTRLRRVSDREVKRWRCSLMCY